MDRVPASNPHQPAVTMTTIYAFVVN
jgi:hypothetical protein